MAEERHANPSHRDTPVVAWSEECRLLSVEVCIAAERRQCCPLGVAHLQVLFQHNAWEIFELLIQLYRLYEEVGEVFSMLRHLLWKEEIILKICITFLRDIPEDGGSIREVS